MTGHTLMATVVPFFRCVPVNTWPLDPTGDPMEPQFPKVSLHSVSLSVSLDQARFSQTAFKGRDQEIQPCACHWPQRAGPKGEGERAVANDNS